jgi:branched-chain amino acid transport system substrate-binding protein
MTGTFAFYGEDQRTGIDVALEEVGDRVEIIYEDSAGENPKAIAAFSKLTDIDGANIVISSTSWISNAVYSQAVEKNVLQVIIASAAFKRTLNDTALRFTVDVKDEAPYILEYLKPFSRVAVLHLNNDYGKGWAEMIQKALSDKVAAVEAYNPGDTDVNAQLSKIKASNPDVLVLVSTGKEGGLFAKKARELGIDVPFASQRPIQSPELLQAGDAVEGLVYSYPAYDVNHRFVSRYKEKFGKEPTVFAAEAYDAVKSIVGGVGSCGSNAGCVYRAYVNSSYDGALGHVTFDEKGDAHYPFVLKQVNDGKFVLK